MKLSEFRTKLSQTANTHWFNEVTFNINYNHLDLNYDFKGLGNLYSYIIKQISGWEKKSNKLPTELSKSLEYFKFVQTRLITFINTFASEEKANSLDANFRSTSQQILNRSKEIFPFEAPETNFLINIHEEHPNYFKGAYTYLIGNLNENISIKQNFNGYLLAYEFSLKDTTKITERRNKEKSSLSRLRNEFENSIPELNNQLVEHLKESTEKYKEFGENLELFKADKEKTYSDWFINTKGDFENFNNESSNRLKELEDTYKEKLKLEEPAKYWSERAIKLKKQGWIALAVVVVLVLIVVYSLGQILWSAPEQIYESFFNGDRSAAIRWSIVYITLISFMAFSIKAITKVMFSSFHLARDCEERHTLTYFYLSLLKDSTVEKEDKKLIMQALFSRAETGLLKDDSSPTMPNDIIGRVLK
ncbi:hypothetical protein AXE80_07195 [Wenyingzhuangia fucanilytica]|uniref:DUF6161 domain-containing protein n=1 Tax=Wenyingzhuangia fucanilytica TaxID=1790137 RepID=A0A1B1Y5M9_9FLAO|nr:DUF6161 domain-containing protein [Wenyingzhuangia fucanilytica]ANW96075.1 hypothetical protein AXE80_07195 [Wenyingzhuangia fucanilytica]